MLSEGGEAQQISAPMDVFLPGVQEGFRKRFPNDDLEISEESDFGIDTNDIVLLDQIARGAYGVVYKGIVKGKTYAIKVQEAIPAEEEQINILVELTLLKSLSHERLISSIGSSRIVEKRSPFEVKIMIVMELCDNGALRECLSRKLSWELRVRIALDVIEGVAFLHEKRIVHRDIKTTNILVTKDWRAKVCDFSFACHVDNLAKHDYVYGTDEFMAPEIALGEDFGTAADIFSFGIVLAEMITGQEPSATFLKRSARELFALNEEELRSAVMDGCPESLEALTFTCCERDGEFRITADDIVEWLQSLFEDLGGNDKTNQSLPEKERNAFSTVVSPIREGTVVYPKTEEAHLLRYKSGNVTNALGAINFMKRSAARSKSMNGTPSREGAVAPLDATTPLEKERLTFGDVVARVSHSGIINFNTGKTSDDNPSPLITSKTSGSEGPRVDSSPLTSLSSMISRISYLELQIQELKAENKSLTRGVSALVMMSEEMKKVTKEISAEISLGDTPSDALGSRRNSSPRSNPRTPTGVEGRLLAATHRKSRSEDVALLRRKLSGRIRDDAGSSPGLTDDPSMEIISSSLSEIKRNPPAPPPPRSPKLSDQVSDAVQPTASTESLPPPDYASSPSFDELRKNVQNLVGSGNFGRSSSSFADSPADDYNSSPSFDRKKGPPGAMKLFDIGGSTRALRKVAEASASPESSQSQSQSNADKGISPYDRSRLRSVPPPPPKSEASIKSSATPPPPPPSRGALGDNFSESQLQLIKSMIEYAVVEERTRAAERLHDEVSDLVEKKLSEQRGMLVELIDSKFEEFKKSFQPTPCAGMDIALSALPRNMSVSFGDVYRGMFAGPEGGPEGQYEGKENLGEMTRQLDGDQSTTEEAPAMTAALSSPQAKQLSRLENQMEIILMTLDKLAQSSNAPAVQKGVEVQAKKSILISEKASPVKKHFPFLSSPNEPTAEDDDSCDSVDYLGKKPQFVKLPGFTGDTHRGSAEQPPDAECRETRSSSASTQAAVRTQNSFPSNRPDGSYLHVSPHGRDLPEDFVRVPDHRSPAAGREIEEKRGSPSGDLANEFKLFLSAINNYEGAPPEEVYQQQAETQAADEAGYYDFTRSYRKSSPKAGSEKNPTLRSPMKNDGKSPVSSGASPMMQGQHAQYRQTPGSSLRGGVPSTPLSASVTWRTVGSGGSITPGTVGHSPQSTGAHTKPTGRGRNSSGKGGSGSSSSSKYNQIGTRGTPRDVEVDSSLAQNFFRMHNAETALGKEEARLQRKSPAGGSGGRVFAVEVGSRPSPKIASSHNTSVSLRQLLDDGN